MKYYYYRIKFEDYLRLNDIKWVKDDLENGVLNDGDLGILIVSKSLLVLGAYRYDKKQRLWLQQHPISKPVTEFYSKIPMIKFVSERTYKIFAKRLREVDKENFEPFLK
jgi:hypothetical protein